MQIKITGDGTPAGTHFVDAQTGEEVPGVYAYTLQGNSERPVTQARLYVYVRDLDLQLDTDVCGSCPHCGKLIAFPVAVSQPEEAVRTRKVKGAENNV